MKTKKKYSILLKTQVYFAFFCVAVLLLLWFFQMSFFSVYFRNYQINALTKTANKIIKIDSKSSNFNETIEDLAYKNNLCILIFQSYGDVNAYNEKREGCQIHNPIVQKKIYNFFKSNKKFYKYHISISKNEQGMLFAVKNGDLDIFLYGPLNEINTVYRSMKNQLIYITLIAIIFSLAIVLFLSNLITKPIRIISKKAKNIGKENYDNTFLETGIKEIDELSDTLDEVQIELGKVQTYQRDLLANVSHDLKTPLTMIKAYAEKIKDISYKDKEKLDSDVQIITDEVDRLTILVNDILDLSKLQNDKEILNIEEYDLVSEINNILKKYEIIKETENYHFITNMPEKAMVKADKNKINQVIYNLINNAINFTGEDKKVFITVENNNKTYKVKISDTGKGIKKEEQKNIWTKYYKNEKNHRRNVVSTGLGLSIVRQILEIHRFKYGVKCPLKKGTTFYFEIISQNKQKKFTKK